MAGAIIANPCCPRCDYDLRGQMAAWADCCPLEETCPECGFTFGWPDVLLEWKQKAPWLIEHSRSRLRGFARTFTRVLAPAGFWSKIKLHHTVVPRRLLVWLMMLLLPGYLLAGAARTIMWWQLNSARTPWGLPRSSSTDDLFNAWLWPVVSITNGWSSGRGFGRFTEFLAEWPAPIVGLVAGSIALPLLTLVLPETRKRSKIKYTHILRAAAYSLWWLLPLFMMYAIADIAGLIGLLTRPGAPGLTRAVVLPLWTQFRAPYFITSTPGLAIVGLLMLWTAWYWQRVIVSNWRLQRATIVWLTLLIPAALVALCAMLIYDPFFFPA